MRARRVRQFALLGLLTLAAIPPAAPAAAPPSFASPFVYPTAWTSPGAVAVCDVTRDGAPDVLVTNFGAGNAGEGRLTMLPGVPGGAGGLAPAQTVDIAPEASNVLCRDLNGDGVLDVAATFAAGSNSVHVLLGRGDGTLSGPGIFATDPFMAPYGLAAADVNSDGRVDLVASGRLSSRPVSLFLGAGGSEPATAFAPRIDVPAGVPTNRTSVALADVDGDGHPDLVTGNFDTPSVSVRRGTGSGSTADALFAAAREYPVAGNVGGIAVGDVDGDRDADIVATHFGRGDVTLLLGTGVTGADGNPVFTSVQQGVGGTNSDAVLGDFNADGVTDVAVAVSRDGASGVVVLQGTGGGVASYNPVDVPVPPAGRLAAADVDLDGRTDLVATLIGEPGRVAVLLNTTPRVPANAAPPVVRGALVVGATVTCDPGTWSEAPTFSYVWLRTGVPMPDPSDARHIVTPADIGSMLACRVTASNAAGSASADSAGVGPVPAPGAGIFGSRVSSLTVRAPDGSRRVVIVEGSTADRTTVEGRTVQVVHDPAAPPSAVRLRLQSTDAVGLPQVFVSPLLTLEPGDVARFTPVNWRDLEARRVRLLLRRHDGRVLRRLLQNRGRRALRFAVAASASVTVAPRTRRVRLMVRLRLIGRVPAGTVAYIRGAVPVRGARCVRLTTVSGRRLRTRTFAWACRRVPRPKARFTARVVLVAAKPALASRTEQQTVRIVRR